MANAEDKTSQQPFRSIYRSEEGERKLRENYDAALHELPFPIEEKAVSTRWGKAHVLVAGPREATPLFLWQGTAAPGPFMLGLFHSFVPKYRVYVADVPSQGKYSCRIIKFPLLIASRKAEFSVTFFIIYKFNAFPLLFPNELQLVAGAIKLTCLLERTT